MNKDHATSESYWYDDDHDNSTVSQQAMPPHAMDSMSNTSTTVPIPPVERRSRHGRLICPPVRYGDEI